jgi:alpha-D-ribose 1-methylphosphonate 5-triphosphate synthase subunit PhnH
MLTVALPDPAEMRSNATFEALMWAMARPGEVRDLPVPGLAPVVEALIDLECAAYGDSTELRRLIAETGAAVSDEVGTADHVFLEQLPDDPTSLAWVRCGSALYPDDGATIVVAARHGEGTRLRMTGPGVDGTSQIRLALAPAFWELRARLCSYPEGFDLVVVDGLKLVAIPRSTKIEVL